MSQCRYKLSFRWACKINVTPSKQRNGRLSHTPDHLRPTSHACIEIICMYLRLSQSTIFSRLPVYVTRSLRDHAPPHCPDYVCTWWSSVCSPSLDESELKMKRGVDDDDDDVDDVVVEKKKVAIKGRIKDWAQTSDNFDHLRMKTKIFREDSSTSLKPLPESVTKWNNLESPPSSSSFIT